MGHSGQAGRFEVLFCELYRNVACERRQASLAFTEAATSGTFQTTHLRRPNRRTYLSISYCSAKSHWRGKRNYRYTLTLSDSSVSRRNAAPKMTFWRPDVGNWKGVVYSRLIFYWQPVFNLDLVFLRFKTATSEAQRLRIWSVLLATPLACFLRRPASPCCVLSDLYLLKFHRDVLSFLSVLTCTALLSCVY